MRNKYVIIWDDGFPTTFHKTYKEAEKLLHALEGEGVSGKIMTRKEYEKIGD